MSSLAPKKFAVIASQRTGSTLLIRSLDSSPYVFCAGELFHAGPGIYHPECQFPYRLLGSIKLSRFVNTRLLPGRAASHLRHFYAQAPVGTRAIGFKLMISHAETFATIMPSLRSLGVTLLYLLREDSFATAMSYYKARASGVFHSGSSAIDATTRNIQADTTEFSKLLTLCVADKSQVLNLHQTFGGHLMSYEEMTAHWDDFVAQLGAWIGLPQLRIERTLSRLSGENAAIRVINESHLRDLFHEHTK